jgi:hypothetical protein
VEEGYELDPTFSQFELVGELERRYTVWDQPGTIKVTGFLIDGRMGSFGEALAFSQATGLDASDALAAVRKWQTTQGVSLNLAQQVTDERGADHPGHGFPGPRRPPNLGGLSWRWLCRLKGASDEKAGIFASAFQTVTMPQKLPFLDLAVCLPGFLRRGRTRVMRLAVLKAMPARDERHSHHGAIAPASGTNGLTTGLAGGG